VKKNQLNQIHEKEAKKAAAFPKLPTKPPKSKAKSSVKTSSSVANSTSSTTTKERFKPLVTEWEEKHQFFDQFSALNAPVPSTTTPEPEDFPPLPEENGDLNSYKEVLQESYHEKKGGKKSKKGQVLLRFG